MSTKRFEQHIASLHNGISRQSPSVRFPNQVADAENVLFSIIDGATTRPGSRHHIEIPNGTIASNIRMHKIERDIGEEYLIVYGKGPPLSGSSISKMKFSVVQVNNPRNRRQWIQIKCSGRNNTNRYPPQTTFTLTFNGITTSSIVYANGGTTGATQGLSAGQLAAVKTQLDTAFGVGVITALYNDNLTPGVLMLDINDEYPHQGLMTATVVGATSGVTTTIVITGTLAIVDSTTGQNVGNTQTYIQENGGAYTQLKYATTGSYEVETYTEADDLGFLTITDTTFIYNKKKQPSTTTYYGRKQLLNSDLPCTLVRTSTNPPTFQFKEAVWSLPPDYRAVWELTNPTTSGTFGLSYQKNGQNVTNVSGLAYNTTPQALIAALVGAPAAGSTFPNGGLNGNINVVKVDNKYTIYFSGGWEPALFLPYINSDTSASLVLVPRDTEPVMLEPFATNKPINDMVYHRGRLGLAMDEWLVFSQPDDLRNVFPVRTDQTDPADGISIQIGAETVSKIDHIVPFRRGLLLLTQAGRQFDMGGGELFTAETASFTPSTAIATNAVKPVSIGFKTYFCGSREQLTPVWEYNYDDIALTNKASEITNHVYDLIPKDIKSMVASDNNSTVMILPRNLLLQYYNEEISSAGKGGGSWSNANTWNLQAAPGPSVNVSIEVNDTITFNEYGKSAPIFVYKQFTKNDELLQSAWSVYDFKTDIIQDIKIVDDTVFIARNHQKASSAMSIIIESMPLTQKPEPPKYWEVQPRMDHRHVFNTKYGSVAGQFDSIITFTLPYEDKTIDTAVIITNISPDLAYYEVPVTNNSGTTVTADLTSFWAGQQNGNDPNSYVTIVFGRKIDFNIVLSRVYEKDQNGNSKLSPIIELSKTIVDHKDSGNYQIQTQPKASLPRKTTFQTTGTEILNKNGKLSAFTIGKTEDTIISISTDSTKPVTITSVEYHGKVTTGGIE